MRRPASDSTAAVSVVPSAAASRSFVEANGGFLFQRTRFGLHALADANCIDDHVAGLAFDAGIDLFHLGVGHDAHAATFHLLEEILRRDAAHEEDDLQRLDVGAGGDHVHGNGDAREVAIAKGAEDLVGRETGGAFPGDFFDFAAVGLLLLFHEANEAGAIGDLLAEVVALAEDFAADADDVVGVGVVLGEDERLRQVGAARKHFSEDFVAEGGEHGANLVGRDDITIEAAGLVGENFVELLPANLARLAVAFVDPKAGVHLRAALRDRGIDAVDVAANVHAVGYGFLVVVFHDEVLLEETEGLFRRRGGEADERGVEVFEHLPPEIVDGAVAFIGDDEVEFLDREIWIVFDRERLLKERVGRFDRKIVEVGRGFFLALQHGVDALDRADDDAGRFVERVAAELLDDVFLGELVVVHGRDELLELGERLPAEIAAVHEEEDALRAAVFHEAIDEIDGGVGLARAGGHLNERAAATCGEGFLQIVDRFDLRGPELASSEAAEIRGGAGRVVFLAAPRRARFPVDGTRKRADCADRDQGGW